jgi:polar amino acid transport system ATP-binding protein
MLESIDGGAVFFQGEMMGFRVSGDRRHAVSAAKAREQTLNFGMVFQSFNLFPNYTALENVMLAPTIVGKTKKKEFRQRAEEMLRRVGLTDKMDNYPSELSGGQQQRVAIARALAMEPKIMLFDEPTSALDPELVGEVLAVMRELALKGSTMLIVTHEMKFAQDVADTIVMMDEGRIIERGTPDQLLNRPTKERTRKFFASVND